MSHWTGRIAFAFCVFLLSVFALVRWVQSCADPGDPFDDFSKHPDVPLEKFVQGELGVVEPTFARSYLVIAYRYASGVPLTEDEKQAAIALLQDREIDPSKIYVDVPPNPAPANGYLQEQQDASEGPQDWADERAKIVSSASPVDVKRLQELSTYNNYVNCANDAFATAAATLAKRAEKFGKDAPPVQAWVSGQDAVFSNCAGDPAKPVVPSAADPSWPEIFRFDREYQIAAAYMYSNQYDQAVQGFQKIAQEKSSSWHDLAPYLAARTMLRRATVEVRIPDAPQGTYVQIPAFDPDKMQAAADFIAKTSAAAPNGPFALPMEQLQERAEYHLHPGNRMLQLGELLSKPTPHGRFYNWLWDYTWLMDTRGMIQREIKRNPGQAEEYAQRLAERQNGTITDWIITFQEQDVLSGKHALELWRMHPESVPWLLAALSHAHAKDQQTPEVLAAAEKVSRSSPAYVSIFYHQMRLKSELGKFPEVRSSIDAYLAATPGLLPVAKDYLLNLRLDAASDLNDAVPFLPRTACSLDIRVRENSYCPRTINVHSAGFLDALPLDLQVEVLHSKNFPDEQRANIVRNVWLRAVMLGRYDVARALDAEAFRPGAYQTPLGDEVTQKLVKEFEAASTPEDKLFAAIFLMQHQYAFGYEMGTAEAWCASPRGFSSDQTTWQITQQQSVPVVSPPFLTEAQRKQSEKERTQLEQADSQANYYTKVVLDYAKKHPDDARVPEALSRAVKNTRMNCNNQRTGDLSQEAFNLLHKQYPDTTWAKNTKYWFGANSF
jgi:TolA-binding protein